MGKGPVRYRLEQTATLAIVFILMHCEVIATGDLSGRLNWSYQKSRTPVSTEEFFFQSYRATLRETMLQNSNVALSMFLDDSKNLTRNVTFRRYNGRLDITNHVWSLNVLFTPRQKTTPLQLETSREHSNNAVNLDIHIPKAPRLRMRYVTRSTYADKNRLSDIRDLRGELSYQYRFILMELNRWDTRISSATLQRSSSTGGKVHLNRQLGRWFSVRAGYDYQFTEWRRIDSRDVTVQAFNGGLAGRYKHYVSGAFNISTRRSKTDAVIDTRNLQNSSNVFVQIFPMAPVSGRIGRWYILNEGNEKLVSDYGEAQILLRGDVIKNTTGRFSFTKRFDVASRGMAVPPDLAFLSITSDLYRQVELRGDMSISHKNADDLQGRYAVNTVLDLFMRPRRNLRIGTYLRRQNTGGAISFTTSNRLGYGFDVSFSGRSSTTIGASLGRLITTNGTRREDTTVSLTLAAQPTPRTSFSVLYGVDESSLDYLSSNLGTMTDQRETLNAQGTFRITRRGSIAVSYNRVGNSIDRSNLVVTYRQEF